MELHFAPDLFRKFVEFPARTAFIFSLILFLFAISYGIYSSGNKKSLLLHFFSLNFLLAVVSFTFMTWLNARQAEVEFQEKALDTCLSTYRWNLDDDALATCIDQRVLTSLDRDESQVNATFFLNLTTEFIPHVFVLAALVFVGEHFLPLQGMWSYLMVIVAMAILIFTITALPSVETDVINADLGPVKFNSISPLQELFLNLTTEIIGAVVIIMVVEKHVGKNR